MLPNFFSDKKSISFSSFTPFSYNIGLLKTLVYRDFEYFSNWDSFLQEVCKINRNEYPQCVVNKKMELLISKDLGTSGVRTTLTILIILTSLTVSKKCKEIIVILIFKSFKLSDIFYKAKTPKYLRSYVVYDFFCTWRNSSYVWESQHHVKIIIDEHLYTEKNRVFFSTLCKKWLL